MGLGFSCFAPGFSALALLMLWVAAADYAHDILASDHAAIPAKFLN
jgi:hypothetical protein